MIDETDREILQIVQENARTSNAEIARRVGMAPSAVFERLRKLEERGVLMEFPARLDARQLGLGVVAFVFVTTDVRILGAETGNRLAGIPEVQEVHHTAGEDCYLLKVRTTDTAALGRLLHEKVGVIPSVRSTRTTIVLETVKETIRLPLSPIGTERD
jgi:Lrp/AsnC family transcriptional regulator, leucine-responsive regulatory protein